MSQKSYGGKEGADSNFISVSKIRTHSCFDKRHILVVDDSTVLRSVLRAALEGEGFDVISARDASEAMATMRMDCSIDLIITDFHMPGLDGAQFIRKVRDDVRHHSVPILVLTAGTDEAEKQRSRDAGASGWIVKPFDTSKLSAAINRLAA